MNKTSLLLPVVFSSLLGLMSASAGGEGWTTDYEAAMKLATDEKKNLLIDFTGSDWCGWCIKLDKEVFSHDEFKTGVKDTLVLVEIDYPRDKSKQPKPEIAQNETLKTKYSIKGYPTILLTDEAGKPFAKTGYQPGGPDKYVAHLNELIALRLQLGNKEAALKSLDEAMTIDPESPLNARIEAMKKQMADAPMPEAKPKAD